MFNSVQYVRDICKQQKIPIARLEKECHFANGYLNPKKMTKIPYDRARIIADYLKIPVEAILTGEEKAPTESGERKFEESEIIFALSRGGEAEITDAMYQEVKNFAAFVAQREAEKRKEK